MDVQKIIRYSERFLSRTLTTDELNNLVPFLKSNWSLVSHNVLIAKEYADHIQSIGDSPDKQLGVDSPEDDKEINEVFDKLNMMNILGLDTLYKIAKALSPKLKCGYVCLDTKYARFLNNYTQMQWDYNDVFTDIDSSTSTVGKVRNIKAIRMLSVVVQSFVSTLNRGSVLIEELQAQSFLYPNQRRFHFHAHINNVQFPAPLDDRVGLKTIGWPWPDVCLYGRYKPVSFYNTITISIGDPMNVIQVMPYMVTDVTITFLSNSGPQFSLQFPEDLPLGSLAIFKNFIKVGPDYFPAVFQIPSLFIDGFSTDQPDADAAYISFVNSKEWTWNMTISNSVIEVWGNTNITGWHLVEPPPIVFPGGLVGNINKKVTVRFNAFRTIMNMECYYEDTNES